MRRPTESFGGAARTVILAVVMGLFPCACTNPPKPFVYETNREIKPGPGLFSGEDGVFTIYGESKDPKSAESAEAGDSGSNATSTQEP